MIKTHISLRVRDVERSTAFYQALFGVPPHKVRPGYANFDLVHPPLKFAIHQHPAAPGADAGGGGGGALDHLGFLVDTKADLEAVNQRLIAAGLATFDETDATCCYAKQDKVWAHDPDGNEWEVYVLTDDLMDDHAHDHAGRPLTLNAGTTPSRVTLGVIEPAHRCCAADGR